MTSRNTIFQICVVVPDVRKANAHWAKILGLPESVMDQTNVQMNAIQRKAPPKLDAACA